MSLNCKFGSKHINCKSPDAPCMHDGLCYSKDGVIIVNTNKPQSSMSNALSINWRPIAAIKCTVVNLHALPTANGWVVKQTDVKLKRVRLISQ